MPNKPFCLLIHGWGMPLGIFDAMIARLESKISFTVIELPGDKQPSTVRGLNAYVDFITAQYTQPAWVLGWSFGGMLALALAQRMPEKVLGLVLVSSTPKFVQDEHWNLAVPPKVLATFEQHIKQDYRKTLQQFLALQTLGAPNQNDLTRQLRALLTEVPNLTDLLEQLRLLKTIDLRENLPHIKQATLWLMGDQDTLIPCAAGTYASHLMPQSKVVTFNKCGHLPFWTHTTQFDQQLLSWISRE